MCRTNDRLFDENRNIVLVEDDTTMLNYYADIINSEFPKCNLELFSNISEKFYNYIYNNRSDLYIMDVVIGQSNAIEISNTIVETYQPIDSVFLFISGYNYNIDSFKHLNGRCIYDFMSKPFSTNIFKAALVSLLNVSLTYKSLHEKNLSADSVRKEFFNKVQQDKKMIDSIIKDFKDTKCLLGSI